MLLLILLGLAGTSLPGCQSSQPPSVVMAVDKGHDYKVVGFFGGGPWRYQRMTHFIPGFLGFDGDGQLADWDLREVVAEAHASGTKVIVSFDGEHWEENFLPMSDNADGSRDRFISNLAAYCLEQNIDGIDYDWEIGGGFSPAQQKLYSDLVIETVKVLRPLGKTVSIDVYFRDEINPEAIAVIDWIQLMSYVDMDEMENMINYWGSRGVPREKLVVGMAAGWGDNNEGFDLELARAKARYVKAQGLAGVMLFRTDLDAQDEQSMLAAVDETLR